MAREELHKRKRGEGEDKDRLETMNFRFLAQLAAGDDVIQRVLILGS